MARRLLQFISSSTVAKTEKTSKDSKPSTLSSPFLTTTTITSTIKMQSLLSLSFIMATAALNVKRPLGKPLTTTQVATLTPLREEQILGPRELLEPAERPVRRAASVGSALIRELNEGRSPYERRDIARTFVGRLAAATRAPQAGEF